MRRISKLTMLGGLSAVLAFFVTGSRAETIHVRTVTPNVNVHTTIGSATGGAGSGKSNLPSTLQSSDTVSQYGSDNGGGIGSHHGGSGGSGHGGAPPPVRP